MPAIANVVCGWLRYAQIAAITGQGRDRADGGGGQGAEWGLDPLPAPPRRAARRATGDRIRARHLHRRGGERVVVAGGYGPSFGAIHATSVSALCSIRRDAACCCASGIFPEASTSACAAIERVDSRDSHRLLISPAVPQVQRAAELAIVPLSGRRSRWVSPRERQHCRAVRQQVA